MRRLCLFLALLAALLLHPRPARAGAVETQIHLLVMGPGEHIFTRGGHAALMVARFEDGEPIDTSVYNFGDTDWNDRYLVAKYLRGNLVFFLSNSGGVAATAEEYGVRQGREVTHQRLNLTPEQVAEVERRLREGIVPGKREYIFHHAHAVCSTRILDLLDDVMKGRLRAELGRSYGTDTIRDYQELIFADSVFLSIASDLFVGRMHDVPLSKYEGAVQPERMRDYLQQVMVPAPSGEDRFVPFSEPPELIVKRDPPLVLHKSWLTRGLWSGLTLLLLACGASAYRRVSSEPEDAIKVAFWVALGAGVIGLLILAFMVISRVPEFRTNELILLFWPTDIWLAMRIRRVLRKRSAIDLWARRYASARLAAAALVVLGHLTGVLQQKPYVLVALGCAVTAVVWAMLRAVEQAAAGVASEPSAPRAPARAST